MVFSIPDNVSSAELSVYDVSGQRVRTIASGTSLVRVRQLKWDATDDSGHRVAPGIYFVRLKAGDQVETRRMQS